MRASSTGSVGAGPMAMVAKGAESTGGGGAGGDVVRVVGVATRLVDVTGAEVVVGGTVEVVVVVVEVVVVVDVVSGAAAPPAPSPLEQAVATRAASRRTPGRHLRMGSEPTDARQSGRAFRGPNLDS
jgi:hypothetical protein